MGDAKTRLLYVVEMQEEGFPGDGREDAAFLPGRSNHTNPTGLETAWEMIIFEGFGAGVRFMR